MLFAVLVTAVCGIAVGATIATVLARRAAPSPPDRLKAASSTSVDVPPDHIDAPTGRDDVAASLREAVDHLEIGVLVVSAAEVVRYRNLAARRFEGTHVGVLVDDHVSSIIEETADGQRASRVVELQGRLKAWFEISADPIPDGGCVVTIRDVSERVRIDSVRTDFVTNISHELKTPVGAIAVLAEALVDEPDDAVVRRLADRLVEEAHRAVRTIDDLLKLSQIESTRPGEDTVDLDLVVQRAMGRGRAVEGGRGIEITTLDRPGGLLVRGDEPQLVSAVGNLVENAVKYSNDGGVVQVRVRVNDASIEIMVADQGIGIPPRDLDRVFERFYRVDKARSRETGGTGLGLSIVRHVATNHGGEVLVSSQEGEGSTFVLRLPSSLIVAGSDEPIGIESANAAEEKPHHE